MNRLNNNSSDTNGSQKGFPVKDSKNSKKPFIIALIAFLISISVILTVYQVIDRQNIGEIDSKEEYLGNIETPAKQWLNGYLGVFFRFKQLSNINWLILPLLIWYFAGKKRKKERWEKALVFVWLLTLLFISIKGYYNFRYQLTLFPFTSAMVLFLLWRLLERYGKVIKILCFSAVALLCIFNIYHYRDVYKNYWDLRVTVKNPHFPYRLMNFFKTDYNFNRKNRVLTINQPIFYYHTSLPGVDYVGPNAVKTWVEFNKKKGTVRSRERLFRLIKRRLKCGYILLNQVRQRFQRGDILEEFLHCECHLAVEDQGWLLYRLRDKPLEKQVNSPNYFKINVWDRNRSKVKTISPPLLRFSKAGKFKYSASKDNNKNIIVINPVRKRKNNNLRLHFGYEFNRKGLEVDSHRYEGMVVNFIVRVAGSHSILDKDNYIAIVDYHSDKSHSAVKTYFFSPHWRTYLLSKKIKPGNSRLLMMIRFCPQSLKDKIKIEDAKIIISKEPL